MTRSRRSRIASVAAAAVTVVVVLGAGTAAARFGSGATVAVGVAADSIPTAPAPSVSITGSTATVSFAPISLAGGRPVQRYELLRNDVTVLPCASSPCQDTGLAPGTYTYRVRGVYQQWHGAWSPASNGSTVSGNLVIDAVARSRGTRAVFSGTGGSPGSGVTVTICRTNAFPCTAGNTAGSASATTVSAGGNWTTSESSEVSPNVTYYARATQGAKVSNVLTFTLNSL